MRVFLSSLMMVVASLSQAATFSLEADGEAPLYRTALPQSVYRYSAQQHLGDLVVTNASGDSVPYALATYQEALPSPETATKPLVIFPIEQTSGAGEVRTQLALQNQSGSTSVNLITEDESAAPKTYFLFDLGKKHPAFKKLSLDWQGQEGRLFNVEVSTSDDLKDWTPVAQAALLKAGQGEAAILQNTITSKRLMTARYLKIQAQETADIFTLTKVNVEFSTQKDTTPPIEWGPIVFKERNQQDQSVTNIDFEALGHYPAKFLKVDLPENNTITQVTVYTRNHVADQWQRIKKTTLFRMRKDGTVHQNKQIEIPKTTARYWRLSFDQENGGIGETPALSLGWLADTLIWNARGGFPYTLHVGDANQQTNHMALASLMKSHHTQAIPSLPVAKAHPLSGAHEMSTWPSPHQDNKRLWLWAGLVLGVAALMRMAYSLLKKD